MIEENSFCAIFVLEVKKSDFVAIQKIKHRFQEIRLQLQIGKWIQCATKYQINEYPKRCLIGSSGPEKVHSIQF